MSGNSLAGVRPSCGGRRDALSTFAVEGGIVEEEPGMEPRNDTSALQRHVPLPGHSQGGRQRLSRSTTHPNGECKWTGKSIAQSRLQCNS